MARTKSKDSTSISTEEEEEQVQDQQSEEGQDGQQQQEQAQQQQNFNADTGSYSYNSANNTGAGPTSGAAAATNTGQNYEDTGDVDKGTHDTKALNKIKQGQGLATEDVKPLALTPEENKEKNEIEEKQAAELNAGETLTKQQRSEQQANYNQIKSGVLPGATNTGEEDNTQAGARNVELENKENKPRRA